MNREVEMSGGITSLGLAATLGTACLIGWVPMPASASDPGALLSERAAYEIGRSVSRTSWSESRRARKWTTYFKKAGIQSGASLSALTAEDKEELLRIATLFCPPGTCSEQMVFENACELYLTLRYGPISQRWAVYLANGFSDQDLLADFLARIELARMLGVKYDEHLPARLALRTQR
jgi:hypothetical protein